MKNNLALYLRIFTIFLWILIAIVYGVSSNFQMMTISIIIAVLFVFATITNKNRNSKTTIKKR